MAQTFRMEQVIPVHEWTGVLIGAASSCLGGLAAGVTRYLVSGADAVTLAILRWV
jgi:hypothetical protein